MNKTEFSHPAVAIGARVRTCRTESKLSEEAVARALNCDICHLHAAEAGQINFTPKNIIDLCPILRVMPSWLFKDIRETS